ncbi:hypothetical protein DFH06DRAFT_1124060 [Mycena polygramma]|nr:hypothetical protein DFH06DRAFT_1124060 [Mycena polygramma]
MTNLTETAAAAESLVGSVAAAALSPSSTKAQREAALQYLATLITLGSPVPGAGAAAPATPPADLPASAPVAAPAPGAPGPPPPSANTAPPLIPNGPFYAGVLYDVVPTSHVTDIGVPDDGEDWYVVLKGKSVGVTQDHPGAMHAVVGVSHNSMKSYKPLSTAIFTFNHALDIGIVEIRPH